MDMFTSRWQATWRTSSASQSWKGCHVFGHSLGAMVAVAAELQAPGTFHAMYLFEPGVYPLPVPEDAEGEPADLAAMNEFFAQIVEQRPAEYPSRQAALEGCRQFPDLRRLSPACLQAFVDHGFRERDDGSVELKCHPKLEAQLVRSNLSQQPYTYDDLRRIHCPVILASGWVGKGPHVDFLPMACRKAAPYLCNGHLEMFEAWDHLTPVRDPEAVARQIQLNFRAAADIALWPLFPNILIIPTSRL
ncbi:hypothetical protein WJX72_006174 [[Myrmecia] bisecta]|uniref:AB hydrolase-1 domain-containing protein n=1 Tax=[Myrmecia] bisecta TaxID=41462 RepID=A0AAW1R7Y4_9CHLO